MASMDAVVGVARRVVGRYSPWKIATGAIISFNNLIGLITYLEQLGLDNGQAK